MITVSVCNLSVRDITWFFFFLSLYSSFNFFSSPYLQKLCLHYFPCFLISFLYCKYFPVFWNCCCCCSCSSFSFLFLSFFLKFWDKVLQFRLPLNSSCTPGWLQTCYDPPVADVHHLACPALFFKNLISILYTHRHNARKIYM